MFYATIENKKSREKYKKYIIILKNKKVKLSKNRVRRGSEKLKKCGKLFDTFTASLDDFYIVYNIYKNKLIKNYLK